MHIQTHPTFAYTHPTSHTNTLNHYHFILKQKNLKTKLTHITKFQISNKNIKKYIKPNNNTIIKNLTIQIYQQCILNISSIIIISYSSKKKKKKKLKTNIKPDNKSHDTYIPMIQIYVNN